jgi:hypothetical protein
VKGVGHSEIIIIMSFLPSQAEVNMASLRARPGRGAGADVMLWDAKAIPLRDRCVDIGAVDLPFGMQHVVKVSARQWLARPRGWWEAWSRG